MRKPRRIEQRVVERVDADDDRETGLLQLVDKFRDVPWIGDQDDVRADLHEHEVRGKRVDVIQRQWNDGYFLALLQVAADPRRHLLQVRDHVAMGQHGTLRDAGGAAGVLQKRDVVVAKRHVI